MSKKSGKKHTRLKAAAGIALLASGAVFLERLRKATKEPESINDGNKYLAQEVEPVAEVPRPTLYERIGKRALDKVLSFCGLVVLAPVFGAIALAIEIDDPGPVLFKQKRVGKDKNFFELHKFRSMKMSTPHDVPTHQLADPDKYITRVGKFLRKTSLDELPQIWDIFRGKMSIIGPRPALWNQEDLVRERDKYGANSVMPGHTGLAQISGRDELEIPAKAALDGEYVRRLRNGSVKGFTEDAKCFVGTISSVIRSEGVVEGGTGELNKEKEAAPGGKKEHILVICQYFHPEQFRINDICTEWVKRGYKVTVVTGIPNYPQGEYYEGYGKDKRTQEFWNGIEIIRLPIEPRGNTSLELAANYMSFVGEGKKWVDRTQLKADIVFTYQLSPATMDLVGIWYAKKFNVPHVLYVLDMWPENVEIITGIHSKAVLLPLQKMLDYIYKNSSKILTSSKSFITKIEKRGVPAEKIVFWPQYAEDFYRPVTGADVPEIPDDGWFNIAFAGNIGYAQGLGILPPVAAKLKAEGLKVRFTIIGDGRYLPELKEQVAAAGAEEYFNFIDRRPAEDIPRLVSAADALLITLSKSEVFAMTIPAKTQSYMACGKPLLVSADGEVQSVVRAAGCGLASDAEDENGLLENIRTLAATPEEKLEEYAANAVKYSKANFDKETLLAQIDRIIEEA